MNQKTFVTVIGIFLLLWSFFIFPTNISAQNKVQKLYEGESYMKCINLCNKNLGKSIDKQNSNLYKSLSIIELVNDKKLNQMYSDPVSEALKGIKRNEKYANSHPSDYFRSENRYRIDKVVRFALNTADSSYNKGDLKYADKILKKIRAVYPKNNLYLYKYAKLFNFNSIAVIKKDKTINEKDLHKRLYEVINNCKKYFNGQSKQELLDDLNLMYNDTAADLETASTILVLYPQKFKQDAEFQIQAQKFQEKYWQIKMLFEVNNTRATGVACGGLLTEPKPAIILSNCLCRTAQKYTEYMNKEDFFSHTGKDGSSPWQRASKESCSADAENLAENFTKNTNIVVKQWLNSEGHCKNIMGFHTKAGFGHAGEYWVQMFK
ncbi:MAG: hypothetical protein DRI94_02430 [Bacteroidetes bacterium]|nr:MAG: hypothetical protein DRI94_02430 [Bacteroidota bacterium]